MRQKHDSKAFFFLMFAVIASILIPYVIHQAFANSAPMLSKFQTIFNIVILVLILTGEALVTFRLAKREPSCEFANSKLNGLTSALLLVGFGAVPPIIDSYFLHFFTHDSNVVFVIGNIVLVSGSVVRLLAIRELNGFFNHSLVLYDSHQVISTGIYSKIRHPAYLGTLLIFIGFSLSYKSFASFLLLGFVLFYILRRIRAEEAMLESRLLEPYRAYKRRSFRLIPFII